jgi:pimeloyl-ACP methyl ester carboxylesterase
MSKEEIKVPLSDGSSILLRRLGKLNGPRIYLSHGNGFAVDGYMPFWGALQNDFDLLLFDFRNHGRNERSDPARHHYSQMVDDLDRVVMAGQTAFGDVPACGVFHSMSARTAMKHGLERPWRWAGLVLFDPPNVPPRGHPLYPAMEKFESRLVAFARERREWFDDPSELEAEYLKSRTSRSWVEGSQGLMARAVLRQEGNGRWQLVCTPALEASIYGEATTLELWPRSQDFPGAVKLIGADPTQGVATGPANAALGRENGFDYMAVKGAGHMLQIEKPDICRSMLLGCMIKWGLGPSRVEPALNDEKMGST